AGTPEFNFQQLLMLRTTHGLLETGVPTRRVKKLWASLRRQLAGDLPLGSIRIFADGDRAVAWDGQARWQPDSGQFLLDFGAAEIAARAGVDESETTTSAVATVDAEPEVELSSRTVEKPPTAPAPAKTLPAARPVLSVVMGGRPAPVAA